MAVFGLIKNNIKHFNSVEQIYGYLDGQSESQLSVVISSTLIRSYVRQKEKEDRSKAQSYF